MAVYLGVSRTLRFLEMKPGEANFWCVSGQSTAARAGDLLLLYFPVANSARVNGVGQVYRITSEPERSHRSPCADRGMAHIDTTLLANLETRVTAKDMKANEVVSKWPALGRSFQGVTFVVPADVWSALRTMIIDRNPTAEQILPAG